MRIPRKNDAPRDAEFHVVSEDAARLADRATTLVERALGVQWYEAGGSDVDLAALTLCRLRRAKAGEKGGAPYGDVSVREALGKASPGALVWIASRAISYMDETGFPEAVEQWFPEEEPLT